MLAAADAAVMVLDAAKGIEPQTLKLFEVCRQRELPLLTFINKWDRPGSRRPRAASTRSRRRSASPPPRSPGRSASPVTSAASSTAATSAFIRFTRTARGATMAPEELVDVDRAAAEEGEASPPPSTRSSCSTSVGADVDQKSFLAGESTPVFFGSALTNFGVRQLLDAVVDLVPAPDPAPRRRRRPPARSTRRSAASCSRCRPTWTRRTATASRSSGCARGTSSGGWSSPTAAPASRSPPSTPTRCSARSARPSKTPTPATWSAWSTPPTSASATRSTSTSRSSSNPSRRSPPSSSPSPG